MEIPKRITTPIFTFQERNLNPQTVGSAISFPNITKTNAEETIARLRELAHAAAHPTKTSSRAELGTLRTWIDLVSGRDGR